MRKEPPGDPVEAPGHDKAVAPWRSAFDTPLLAGNLAHELTNALLALHLHLDAPPAANRRTNGQAHGRAVGGRSVSGRRAAPASQTAIDSVLARLDELSRGLRLVAGVPGLQGETTVEPRSGVRTPLTDWWSMARIVVLVSIPKGIDIQADLPRDLPPALAEPAELTACAVMVIRRAVGRRPVDLPRTLRLIARPEGRWIRILAVAHGLSRSFETESSAIDPANGARFQFEEPDPRSASVLVARAAVRSGLLGGKVP